MADRYRVVRECAYATVDTPYGRVKTLVYHNGIVPAGAPELEHLLSIGAVVPVDGGGTPAASPEAPAEPTPPVVEDVDPEVEQRRAEARAKLAELGGTPDGRSSEAVWVEYAVAQGLDRNEAERVGKDELRKALGR